MSTAAPAIAFGPVPSRRLGRSLGINHIPPKSCSYACIYCQVGPTPEPTLSRRAFYPPERVRDAVWARLAQARARGEPVDYLTFVPDGEPTLDEGLERAVELLRPAGIPIAVISNGSLLWRPEVRRALAAADWVSVKVDAVHEPVWRRLQRPHPDLTLDRVLAGVRRFAAEFPGTLASETMLVAGVNDGEGEVDAVAAFLEALAPAVAYLAAPTRPPAVAGVTGPDAAGINRAYQVFSGRLPRVELLVGYEGDAFAASGDAAADLLAVTAVHPMRESAVRALLERNGADWAVVERLLESGRLRRVAYRGESYYLRRPPVPGAPAGD